MINMRFLSMLRPEIVSLAVLVFIQLYSYVYRKATAKIFRQACWAAISHLIFDIITVLTVNKFVSVSDAANDIFHFILYITAMIFCVIYLDYIAAQTLNNTSRKHVAIICRGSIGLYLLASPFMTIEYTEDPITNYSGGNACYIVMGTAFAYYIIAIALLMVCHKKVETYVFTTILLTTLFMMVCVVMQLLIPTFLFTGCGIAIATVGMFFAIENPVKYYQQRAFIDIGTGVKNKNCFHEDIRILTKKRESSKDLKLTIVVGDLNWLKYTNDNFGHLAGDDIIRRAGELLTKLFKAEYSVYRYGGDEFLVLFVNKNDDQVRQEIANIYAKCIEIDKTTEYPFSLALGFATSSEVDSNDMQAVITLADKRMYEEKSRMKDSHPEYCRSD